jgi:hypothetical protein
MQLNSAVKTRTPTVYGLTLGVHGLGFETTPKTDPYLNALRKKRRALVMLLNPKAEDRCIVTLHRQGSAKGYTQKERYRR